MKNTHDYSINGMVKMTDKNIPVASPCIVHKADGTTKVIQPMESKYDYGDSTKTKIGGKSSQNFTYLKDKEGE